MKNKVLVACVVVCIASVAMLGCGGSSTTSSGNESSGGDTKAAAPAETASPAETPASDYACTIDSSALGTDYEGKQCIIVNYTFTNNGEEATSPMVALQCKAYQNGVQLGTAILSSTDGYDATASMKDVKTGGTLAFQDAYILDDTSEVEIEVSDWANFTGDNVIATQTFAVQ